MNLDLSASFDTLNQMGRAFAALLPNLIIALLVLLVARVVAGAAGRVVERIVEKTDRPANVSLVMGRLTRWAVFVLGLLVALTIAVPSFNAGTLIGALGVSGVAIGFAFKDIFQNLLAGLLLLLTRPFQIGDVISSGAHDGTVEDIQVRATLVRTVDNRLVVIPNSDLYTNRVVVLTSKPTRRGEVVVGIGYGDDIEQAKRIVLDAISGLPQLEREPAPAVYATELADSSVNLSVRFWVGPSTGRDLLGATDAVIVAIKKALDAANVEIAYPTQTLLLQRQVAASQATARADAASEPQGD
ncbi:mechanosensitive ion channel family protein [Ottowia sp.]|uniref:mechanosensitive ion channel family protein n=1 Tax=Ottowia sp. TaxID=1898956 RepID=UPI00262C55A0|nr:mechanosensitive ion channel family protein [Ottowia sp.]